MPGFNKEKCICQICICGQHRCEASKNTQISGCLSKIEEKTSTEREFIDNETSFTEEETSSEKGERSRKQWETSPDQMKEISRSLSELNGPHLEKRDQQLVRKKRSKSKENLVEKQTNQSTLPPINPLSDSDSGKELTDTCICEGMYKSNGALDSNQWVVSRPTRNKPKDNLQLGMGPMEMETTFKTSYDSTAKQINESLSKNVAIIMPSNRLSSDESNFEQQLKASKFNELNAIKSSKKKSKHRPSTSLKAGGDGYFNTINKESYKNFVIIDDKSKAEKSMNGCNGKQTSVCCSTVSNIKLPKVDSNNREDQQITRRLSREDKASQIEIIDKSMQNLSTSDRFDSKNVSHKTQTNGDFCAYVDSSAQTLYGTQNDSLHSKPNEHRFGKKTPINANQSSEFDHDLHETTTSWTVDGLEEHKRVFTRDVDSIKELGLMDKSDKQIQRNNQIEDNKTQNALKPTERSRETTRVRYESKNYVQQQRRPKQHKNESSIKLFDGDMDFMTTTKIYYADKSPNRADPNPKPAERERTAGKRSRKSGRKRNLFRTSTEAEFYQPYGQKSTQTAYTTYQKQFGDRLYCPVIDLGSNKSDFKYRGEASGHKFFLPAVNN